MSIAISAVCTGERAGAVSYFQTNLVSDGFAAVTDPALKNSWGTTETSESKRRTYWLFSETGRFSKKNRKAIKHEPRNH